MIKFYRHLVEIETITMELDQLDLSKTEKLHLAKMADATLHSHILDAILSHLSETDKAAFVHLAQNGDDAKIWDFLNQRIDKVEDRIKTAAVDLKKELHQDIAEAKLKKVKGDI